VARACIESRGKLGDLSYGGEIVGNLQCLLGANQRETGVPHGIAPDGWAARTVAAILNPTPEVLLARLRRSQLR
jgi:hypothetical protein